jgi:hypothetical protein
MDEMPNDALTPPPDWEMQIFEVVPRLLIGTKILPPAEYASIGVDAIVDLEKWDLACSHRYQTGCIYLRFPLEYDELVDKEVREGRGLRRLARPLRPPRARSLHRGPQPIRSRRCPGVARPRLAGRRRHPTRAQAARTYL